MRRILLLCFLLMTSIVFSQINVEMAHIKGLEAIDLIDEGKLDEALVLLRECEELDPDDYSCTYEVAYIHAVRQEYQEAIDILKKIKKLDPWGPEIFQMLGNCYSYLGHPKKAIKEYEAGMELFPDAGMLYLERGNIYLMQENYDKAIENYEQGIEMDPRFPSNYYRLAKLFLHSNDILSGMIYGEIFMNLDNGSDRYLEMSRLLYQAYQEAITINDENKTSFDFCKIVIDIADLKKAEDFEMPLCFYFNKNIGLAVTDEKELNIASLASIRTKFIQNYFEEDYLKHPNPLFDYHKKMLDEGVFDSYSHYILHMGNIEEFEAWFEEYENDFYEFVEWYTDPENFLDINDSNKFIRQ